MATPSDVTHKRGTRYTSDAISQEKPLDISNKIWMFDPNKNKALGWSLINGVKRPVFNHIYGHLEDPPFPNWVEYAGADESSQEVTGLALKTGHGARLTLGSRVYWTRTREIMRLDAVMSTDSTAGVTRNYGRGSSSDLLQTGDQGLIIPPAFQQGFTMGTALTQGMVYKSFATSEVSWPVQVANIENVEQSRGGNPFVRALNKSVKAAKDQMEGELIFGAKRVSTLSGAPITVSEGLDNYITTHSYTGSTLSRLDLWDILLEVKRTKSIWCSTAFKAIVAQWAMSMTQYMQGTKEDGMVIDRIVCPAGTFDLVTIDLFDQDPYLMGTLFFVPDGGHLSYCPLEWAGQSLDIKYNPISRDEIHAKEGEVYGVYGWEFNEEEAFGKFSGLQLAS